MEVSLSELPEIHNDLTRRDFLTGAGSLLAFGATGCGGGGSGEEATATASQTIEHKYGSTEIPEDPERIVTVGLTEQDYLLALGVVPVGTREWFGEYPGALWPWAKEALGDEPVPEVLPVDELNFEQISTLDADLILGVNSRLTQDEYDTLSEIAPTVAQPAEYADFGVPWQEMSRIIGRAVGREERAEELVSEIEARFDGARENNPEFEGSTGLLAADLEDGTVYVYAEGPAPRFLTSLGLDLPSETEEIFTGEDRAPVPLSLEQFELLEADVLAMGTYGPEGEGVAERPVFQALDVSQEGRTLSMPEMSLANGAITFSTLLSLPTALDEIVPRIAAAIDGDPDTEVEPIESEAP
ncbi:MAG: iron-siderophore ABC transporter substrate-binding protein [Rubrobacter sp.]|nr:iron-siderophore ABC transporter substrate-binding protein [Rubrobacter sp.]